MSIKSVFLAAAVFILSLGVKPAYSYKVGDVDIRLKAIISEQYDDNVTYASSNEKDDFVNIAGFGLLAKGEGKMQQLDLGGNVIWHTYNKNEGFNYTSENLFLNYRREYSKFDTVRLKDSFIHSEEPASFEDEFGRTTGRYTFIKNWFNTSYTKELTENFSSTFSYFNNAAAFSSSGPSDSFLNGTSIQGHYLLNAKNIINLIYRFESRSYDTGGHVRVNSYTGGIKHFLTERLYAHGSIGQDHVKSTLSSDNGLHLSAGITDELNENTTLGILYLRELSTTTYNRSPFESWRWSFYLDRGVFRRLDAILSAFYGEGEYTGTNIEDTLTGASAVLSYDLSQRIKINLGYYLSRTSSNVAEREYTKNRVYLGANLIY